MSRRFSPSDHPPPASLQYDSSRFGLVEEQQVQVMNLWLASGQGTMGELKGCGILGMESGVTVQRAKTFAERHVGCVRLAWCLPSIKKRWRQAMSVEHETMGNRCSRVCQTGSGQRSYQCCYDLSDWALLPEGHWRYFRAVFIWSD